MGRRAEENHAPWRNVIFTQGDVRVAMSYHSCARAGDRRTTVQRDFVKRCGMDGAIVAVLRLQGPFSHDWARRVGEGQHNDGKTRR